MSKIPSATVAGRAVSLNLATIDRLEKEFGVSFMEISKEVFSHFEKHEEGEGEERKQKYRMTSQTVRIGFAARFLSAMLNVTPDEVLQLVPRGKIVHEYAAAVDPFIEAVQQIAGAEDDSESPTPAGTSKGSGDSERSVESV